jgi:hypothetical protein
MEIPDTVLNATDFHNFTSLFLFSMEGSKYQPNFFTQPSPMVCGKPLEKIEVYKCIHSICMWPSRQRKCN